MCDRRVFRLMLILERMDDDETRRVSAARGPRLRIFDAVLSEKGASRVGEDVVD